MTLRVVTYVIPCVVFAVLLNLPKFFETQIVYKLIVPENVSSADNHTDMLENTGNNVSLADRETFKTMAVVLDNSSKKLYRTTYELTPLRSNPDYIRYSVDSEIGSPQILSWI